MDQQSSEYVVGWGTLMLINAGLAQSKGRGGLNWFLLSIFLGPVATFLIVVLDPIDPSQRVEKIYDLDAAALAEQGIARSYAEILPELRTYAPNALSDIEEIVDQESGRYEVVAGSRRYQIRPSSASGNESEIRGVATFALFDIVNSQLSGTLVKFYAIDSGNSLKGVFLLPMQVAAAQNDEGKMGDRPYIPTATPPLFGRPVSSQAFGETPR